MFAGAVIGRRITQIVGVLSFLAASYGGAYTLGVVHGKAEAVAAAKEELAKKQVEAINRANELIKQERDRLLFEESIHATRELGEGEAVRDLGGGGLGIDRVRRLNQR